MAVAKANALHHRLSHGLHVVSHFERRRQARTDSIDLGQCVVDADGEASIQNALLDSWMPLPGPHVDSDTVLGHICCRRNLVGKLEICGAQVHGDAAHR